MKADVLLIAPERDNEWPKECNEARKDCFEQEFRFLEGWV